MELLKKEKKDNKAVYEFRIDFHDVQEFLLYSSVDGICFARKVSGKYEIDTLKTAEKKPKVRIVVEVIE